MERRDAAIDRRAFTGAALAAGLLAGGGPLMAGGSKEAANTALLRRWYDQMWSTMQFDLIPSLAGPTYVRHHSRGATDPIVAEDYARIAAAGSPGKTVTEFNYRLIAEGDYVGSIGRMVFDTGLQWDWVQMFRVDKGKLVETWLPGMGGNDPRAYPRAEAAWTGAEVPPMTTPITGNKAILARWYDKMWSTCDFDMVPQIAGPVYVRHDMSGAVNPLTGEQYRDALKRAGSDWKITDFRYFLIGQDDLVIAIGTWKMGGGKQWDWVQAFRVADGKLVETWLPALGGTDTSFLHSAATKWSRDVIPAPFEAPRP